MQSDLHTFLQAIRIPNAELWYSRDSDLIFSTESDVQILYSQSLDQFILRVHDFKVLLDKSLPIISAVVGRNQRQAYVLPRGIGFSMIRLADAKSSPAIQNFETILENTTSFSRGSGLDSTLATFKEHKETGFGESILKTMSKAFTHHDDSHPNQKIVRSFEDLKSLDSHGSSVVDLSDGELETLKKKTELDTTGSGSSDLWKSFTGESSEFLSKSKMSSQSKPSESSNPLELKEGHKKTSDVEREKSPSGEDKVEMSETAHHFSTCRYHPSIDHQEVVGPQEQRLPSYEIHNSSEFLQRSLRKASTNLQGGSTLDTEKVAPEENVELPEPEHFEDEAFTFGLLTRDPSKVSNVGSEGSFPIAKEDAFQDLTHPMRKFSSVDRPFLNVDEEHPSAETDEPKPESHKGFTGKPILTAKGQPTLKSNIDDQPSPIPNTEKYSEPTQPEKSSFSKSTDNGNGRELSGDTQPMQPSTIGQQNIVRESSQGNETKKQKKFTSEPVDKENMRSPTTI